MNNNKDNASLHRFRVLDGWRGVSILLVLATHLLPLGPKAWSLNLTSGPMGMTLFFILSGFLITHFLFHKGNIVEFIIRRFFRIIPLAWLCIAIALFMVGAENSIYAPHFLFYANLPPFWLTSITAHIWSLCMEVQFYVAIAILFVLLRKRGLFLIPLLCVLTTAYRFETQTPVSIVTYLRIDEILAGGTLALVFNTVADAKPKIPVWLFSPYILIILLAWSSHPDSGVANYFRPYIGALLVGATLFNENSKCADWLKSRVLFYFAAVSYALYVIHPLLVHTWLGSGEGWEKYSKRPLLLIALFLLAHFSTFYYERRWIDFGKKLSVRLSWGSRLKKD